MLFSQRMGIKPVKNIIQIDSVDDELRTKLWNLMTLIYWERRALNFISSDKNQNIVVFIRILYHEYFKESLDSLDDSIPHIILKIRTYYFGCNWWEVYDFIEFCANNYPDDEINKKFVDLSNRVLEEELSAYRFIDRKITKITSEEEIYEIEESLQIPMEPVKEHIRQALNLLADRKNPDYRNSIKESISAVESLCGIISEEDRPTLKRALNSINDKLQLDANLKAAFINLYSYTSTADGIRHGMALNMANQSNIGFQDAKFMLVICSAFVNYLTYKLDQAKIPIE